MLINVFLPIYELCAPVSIMQFKPLGLLVWKLTDVEPDLMGPLSGQPRRELLWGDLGLYWTYYGPWTYDL